MIYQIALRIEADSPLEAAKKVYAVLPQIEGVFTVRTPSTGNIYEIDLTDICGESVKPLPSSKPIVECTCGDLKGWHNDITKWGS